MMSPVVEPSPELLRAFSLTMTQYRMLANPEIEDSGKDPRRDLHNRGLLDESGRTPLGDTVLLSITLLIHSSA